MKKQFSKWLAGMMALVMIVGMLPTAAFATVGNEDDDRPLDEGRTSITVTVRDARQTTKTLANAGVKLERVTAGRYENLGTQYTGQDGTTTWNQLESGWYRITQISVPDGYKVNNTPIQRWFGTNERNHVVSIEDYPQNTLTVTRLANGNPVKGASYEVRDTNDGLIAAGATDETGTWFMGAIPPGDYTVREVSTPTGIDKVVTGTNPRALHVSETQDSNINLLFTSSVQPTLLIHYMENETGMPVEGARFTLTRVTPPAGIVSTEVVTNANGIAAVPNLVPGDYTLTQTYMPNGYIQNLQNASFTVRADSDGAIVRDFWADRPGSVTILVADSLTGAPIPGAEVTLYSQGNKVAAGPQTTNTEGRVTFAGLPSGNYTAVISGVPGGYTMDTTTMPITIAPNLDIDRVFTATQRASLTIYAQSDDGKALANCVFTLRHQNGTKVGTYKTGASGSVLISDLEDGYYVVEQESAPDGYVITSSTQTVRVRAGAMAEMTFISRAKPYVIAYGYVNGTSVAVPGATYQLWNSTNTQVLKTITADNSGSVIFDDLTPGTYVVQCVSVPAGHTLISGSQTVTVTAKKAGVATFIFDKHSSIVVKALDDKDGTPLVGAMFQIRSESGQVIEQITSDVTGCAVSKTLTPGKYIIEQFYAPDGYAVNTEFQTIMVENNKTSLATFTQRQKSVITIYATDEKAMGIMGVQFAIYDGVTGVEVAQLVSDEAGVATSSVLKPGVYTVKELAAPEGYLLTTSYQTPVVVYGDEAVYVRFPHVKQDYLYIETVDMTTRAAIPGAQYSVTKLNGDLVGNYTAGIGGTVEVGPLTPGFYIVKQIVAPNQYRICSESQTIEVVSGRVLNCRFANYKLTGIGIEARDQITHVGLPNVTFEIYDDDNKQVFHGTTDASGYLATGDLPAGKYTIKQMTTPNGYTAVETTKIVTVTSDTLTTAVFEFKAHTSLVIELVDAENKDALAGSRFKVEDINGNYITTVVTDEGGTAIVTNLAAGKYMVTQVEAPEGYILEGNYQWAEIKAGVEKTYVKFTNNRISGLTIKAIDRNTQAPLAGATFEISEENGKVVKTVTTDKTGVVAVSGLKAGIYLVKETKGPDGYEIDTASQRVTITNNANTTITFNHVVDANLTLRAVDAKSGAVIAGVTFHVTKADGTYVGEYTTGANGLVQLAAAAPADYTVNIMSVPDGYILNTTARTFTVKANTQVQETFVIDQESGAAVRVIEAQTGKGVKGVSLKITTLNGTLVGNYTSNGQGYINVDLKPGEYIAWQTYIPDGYEKDYEPHNFVVKANVTTNIELEVVKESHVRIQVIDAATKVGVYNVQVEIEDSRNNYIGRYRTDNEGFIYLDTVLASGRYKVTMLNVPDGYVLDTTPKTVSVGLDETTDIKWTITGQQGQLTITTLSAADNTLMGIRKNARLQGAVYQITDTAGTVVGTIYGDSYGEAHSGALAIGTYYVQQIQAPAGYMVNDQRVTVRVSSKNDDVKITVYNKSGNFATSVESHGPRTVAANKQAKFYWTNVCNKSTVAVQNFFLHIKVPTDGARAGTFYTGTWTGTATNYYIEYKTNYSDYRILAQNLNSKSQYSYDLSSIALGLNSGEYVTDIRMVFAKASAGMKESMAPSLYVTVLPNVVNGFQLINRAEAGCQGAASASVSGTGTTGANTGINSINDGWTSSSSQSTTSVSGPAYSTPGYPYGYPYGTPSGYPYYYPQYPLPSQLPKTGY